ncbi:MAG: hypothetical protein KHW86_11155 [Porphyromonadaceae bacterium]|nr:hypothetical protein [Porphyromonadaceae bacterium]
MENVQPSVEAQKKLCDIDDDVRLPFTIPGTSDVYKIGFLKSSTCNMITRLLVTRKVSKPKSDSTIDVVKSMSKHSYIPYKVAAYGILNSPWKIRLFHGFLWRKLARKYDYSQVLYIVQRVYDNIDLAAFFLSMALAEKMMNSMKMMTQKEVGQYAAELESELKGHSSKNSRRTRKKTT